MTSMTCRERETGGTKPVRKHSLGVMAGASLATWLFTGMCVAWFPVDIAGCVNAHKKLGEMASDPERLDPAEYPDLARFRPQLVIGSQSEEGHLNDSKNGARITGGDDYWGSLSSEWDKGRLGKPEECVTEQYKKKAFTAAYVHLGIMGHLVQDMSLPAHAFDIQHLQYNPNWEWPIPFTKQRLGDNLEKCALAKLALDPQPVAGFVDFGKDPLTPFQDIRKDARLVVTNNADGPGAWNGVHPRPRTAAQAAWSNYWRDKGPGDPLLETISIVAYFTGAGDFEGKYGANEFMVRNEPGVYPPNYFEQYHRKFMNARAAQAIRYTAGCWAAASKALPPLVLDVGDPGVFLGGDVCFVVVNAIQFTVRENRKATVKISVFIDEVLKLGPEERTLLNESDQAMLPWRGDFTAEIKLTPGTHTVRIEVLDRDDNLGVKIPDPVQGPDPSPPGCPDPPFDPVLIGPEPPPDS